MSEPLKASCMDCGLDYEDFPLDMILPDRQWGAINPNECGDGLLCAQCITRRAAGLSDRIILFAQIISHDDYEAYSSLKNVPIADLAAAVKADGKIR